ncbi:MAG: hypothetical protein AAF629_04110 [Chloroflexota bacterium]
MIDVLDTIFIISHILAGFTALLIAPVAMWVHKGGLAHRRWGKVYYWAMFGIFVTAIALLFLRFNFFLFVIAILSFYTAFTGVQGLKRKRPHKGETPTWLDWGAAWIALVAGLSFMGWGIFLLTGLLNENWPVGFAILGIFFGVGISYTAYEDIRIFRSPPKDKVWWWYYHMNRMLSSYIAVVTAFLVVNLTPHMPPNLAWIVWAGPGIIGSPLIGRWISHYRRQFNRETSSRIQAPT